MSAAPRVAYVVRAFPRLSETFILNEILALRASGVGVQVYALERTQEARMHPDAARLLPDVRFVPDAIPPARGAHAGVPAKQRRWAEAGAWIGEQLRADRVGHVHAHFAGPAATAAAFAARRAGGRYTFTAHAKDIFTASVDWDWLEPLGREAHAVVTVCDYNRRWLRRRMPGARIVRIYNGVDLARWTPSTVAPSRGRVVAIGRLVRKKGFHVLVEALGLLRAQGRDVRAVLIGDGRERGALEARVRELGLRGRVTFAGARTSPEVRRIVRGAGLVTLPSVVDADGNQDALPTVLIEAHACGVPVVATRVAGIPEIVRHGLTGLVVPPDDAPALAAALHQGLSNRARRRRWSRAARAHAEARFDQARAVKALARLFREPVAAQVEREEVTDARRAAVS